jgi:xanthosine utilization system XapX-like protein
LLNAAQPRWTDALDLLKEGLKMQLTSPGPIAMAILGGLLSGFLTLAVFQLKPIQWESQAILSFRIPNRSVESRPSETSPFALAPAVLSRDSLLGILEREKLYPALRSRGNLNEAIEQLQNNIRIEPLYGLRSNGMFTITFRDRDPFVANQVTRDLVARFMDENARAFERFLGTGFPSALARKPDLALEFFYPATRPESNRYLYTALALAEGSQLGLIFALLRRRSPVTYT